MAGKFELKCGAELHNFFEIELISDGEVKQKGFAQNVILENFFSKYLPSYDGRYHYISIGQGTGTPSASDKELFDKVGDIYTQEPTHYTIDHSAGKYGLKTTATIAPHEHAGVEITEVGLKINYTLCSHAMIKDAEGNPITIKKTATDEVKITSYVFVSLLAPDGWIVPKAEKSVPTKKIVPTSRKDADMDIGLKYGLAGYSPTGSWQHALASVNKSTKFENRTNTSYQIIAKGRVAQTDGNGVARYISVDGIVKIPVNKIQGWKGIDVVKKSLGKGDGTKTEFQIEHPEITNLKVYKNGISLQSSEYTLSEIDNWEVNNDVLGSFIVSEYTSDSTVTFGSSDIVNVSYSESKNLILASFDKGYRNYNNAIALLSTKNQRISLLDFKIVKPYRTGRSCGNLTSVKSDEQNFNIIDEKLVACSSNEMLSTVEDEILTKLTIGDYKFENEQLYTNFRKKKITFTTPPLTSDEITADYHVDYIPKDENHVVDISFTITVTGGVPS